MTLTIDLTPEEEARLAALAQQKGKPLDDALGTPLALLDSTLPMLDAVLLLGRYVRAVMERLLAPQGKPGEPTLTELEAFFEAMSEDSEALPALPSEAFTRESIYADHD
ncbi:MAG TPA: hypothetical protein VFB21_19830 [Chthonomonadaceae bacterium]|nr:hypothetical protein [Chthonomonadaceae bacterium]